MSIKDSTIVENTEFVRRFIDALGTSEPAVIQRLLNISYQAAKNYLNGRLPDAKVLITIAEKRKVSLNWLLTGEGDKFLTPSKQKEFNVEEAVVEYDSLEDTIQAWYHYEGKQMPEDFSLNFHFWKDLSMEDKIQTVKDIKNFADRMNEKIDRGELDV